MTYLDSPNRPGDVNNTSPLTLFDSPSLSGNRYNYQALSCESPPANFEDLRTPMQAPRRNLDWVTTTTTTTNTTAISSLGRSIFSSNNNRTASNENKDAEKNKQQQQKIISSPIKERILFSSPNKERILSSPNKEKILSSPIKEKILSSPIKERILFSSPNKEKILSSPNKEKSSLSPIKKSTLKSPFGDSNKWNSFANDNDNDKEDKNLMALDVSPIKGSFQKNEYKIAHSTPIRPEFQSTSSSDTSSPIKFSPLIRKEFTYSSKKSPTEISQHRNFDKDDIFIKSTIMTTHSSIKKNDDKHSKIKDDNDDVDNNDDNDDKNDKNDKNDNNNVLSYSGIKANNNDDHDHDKIDKKEDDDYLPFLYKPYSERLSTTNKYSRYSFHYSSPNKEKKENEDNNELLKSSTSTPPPPSPQEQQPSTYRSPVYSNSSYKISEKKQSSTTASPQKSIINNNTDDTIKQSSILQSPIKSDKSNTSNISFRSPSYSTTQNNNYIHNNINNDGDKNDKNDDSNGDDYQQQQKENSIINSKSLLTTISTSATTLRKNKQREELNTQTSSQGSNTSKSSSSSSSKRRYKYIHTELPHYMRSTESFQNRIHSSSENTKLHKTISGGITKPSSSNLTRFKSTTKINAADDIRNEMTPEDVYIPLAARVKLFEKGLGNGIKPSPINNQKQPNVSSAVGTVRLTKPKSPHLLTRERSLSSSRNCYRSGEPSSSARSFSDEDSVKNVRPTNQRKYTEDHTYTTDRVNSSNRVNKRSYSSISSSTATNKNDHHTKKMETKRQRRYEHPPLEVKPFHFATDDRAARYQELFQAKLKLWKEKENQEKTSQKRHK